MSKELLFKYDKLGSSKEIKFLIEEVLSCSSARPKNQVLEVCLKETINYGYSFDGIIEFLKFIAVVTEIDETIKLECEEINLQGYKTNAYGFSEKIIKRFLSKLEKENLLTKLFVKKGVDYNIDIRAFVVKENYIPSSFSAIKKLLVSLGLFEYHSTIPNLLVINSAFKDFFEKEIITKLGAGAEKLKEKKLILFVHGLNGNKETWTSFIPLFNKDKEIKMMYDWNYYIYPTSLFSLKFWKPIPSIQQLAEGLKTLINYSFQNYNSIVLVCHSMGGLVARQYILTEIIRGNTSKVDKIIMYATPNNGSGMANIGKTIKRRHYQLRQLCKKSEFIDGLNDSWEEQDIKNKIILKYVIGGVDNIVEPRSAKGFWGNANTETLIEGNHFTVIEPDSNKHLSYQVLRDFLFV